MIAIDIEATGTNQQKHSILSLGALDFNNPKNRIYIECHAWEGSHINPDAIKVCGFTEKEAKDKTKQTEAQLIGQFITWADKIEDQTFLGQNVSFDRDYVKAACERAGYNYPFAHRTVDTHSLAYMHHILHKKEIPIAKRHSALNIETIATYLGMPEEPEPHNALTGALYHAEMAHRLLYGKKLLKEFKNSEVSSFD